MQRACDFLARREHSRKELKYKLARACGNDTLIDELLDKLVEKGLQSDERFTETFIYHRVNKGQGPVKIEQELLQRGIKQEIINRYLYADSLDWITLAENARVKKFGEESSADYQNKLKQSRFLYSRGFNNDVINQILK